MIEAHEPEPGQNPRHTHNYMTLGDVAEFLRVPLNVDDNPLTPELLASGVSVDSRQVRPGDIYVALPGDRFHGIDFVGEAARRGPSRWSAMCPHRFCLRWWWTDRGRCPVHLPRLYTETPHVTWTSTA
ncbi:Mur ligase domain-containing protein [Williamsia sp. DF01-3]|uniref:Mur ligase domain-containing protein n=1 Tax=Williamsia sp. DF01-3 TaxID=2934157 RepID=UPI0035AF7FEC